MSFFQKHDVISVPNILSFDLLQKHKFAVRLLGKCEGIGIVGTRGAGGLV